MPCTTISVKGPKGAKKDKKPVTKRTWTYVHIRTFSYNISQNYIGYGVFRKHSSLLRFSKTCQFWRQLQKPTDDCVFRCRQSSLQSSHVCEKRGKTLSYLSLGTIIKKTEKMEVKRKIGKRKKNDRVDLGTKHDPPFLTQVHRNGRRSFVLRVFLTHQ